MIYTLLVIGTKHTEDLISRIRDQYKKCVIYNYGDFSDVRNEIEFKIAIERGLPIIALGALNSIEDRKDLINRLKGRQIECAVSISEAHSNEFIEEPLLSEGFFLIADLDKAKNIRKHTSPTIIAARRKTFSTDSHGNKYNVPQQIEVKIPRIPIIKTPNIFGHENIYWKYLI